MSENLNRHPMKLWAHFSHLVAQCSRCGVETDLYLVGIPICPRCDDVLQQLATNLNSREPDARTIPREETGRDCMMILPWFPAAT